MALTTSVLKGIVAGMVATAPMTASMTMMKRWLPWWQQGPLPPHKVTSETLKARGMEKFDEEHHELATWVGHFGYGAAAGALYPLFSKLPLPTFLKSILYGVGVWTASYMGWIPAAGLLEPATKRPVQRNLLMIVAHVVWGLTMGMIFKRLRSDSKQVKTERALAMHRAERTTITPYRSSAYSNPAP